MNKLAIERKAFVKITVLKSKLIINYTINLFSIIIQILRTKNDKNQ